MATGWDNGLNQDYDRKLGAWFASRIDTRYTLRRMLMTPTPELRFVERTIKTPYGNDGAEVSKTIRVLQQKWEGGMREETEGFFRREIEWRDVPLVKDGD